MNAVHLNYAGTFNIISLLILFQHVVVLLMQMLPFQFLSSHISHGVTQCFLQFILFIFNSQHHCNLCICLPLPFPAGDNPPWVTPKISSVLGRFHDQMTVQTPGEFPPSSPVTSRCMVQLWSFLPDFHLAVYWSVFFFLSCKKLFHSVIIFFWWYQHQCRAAASSRRPEIN